jgi:hypothetical protein
LPALPVLHYGPLTVVVYRRTLRRTALDVDVLFIHRVFSIEIELRKTIFPDSNIAKNYLFGFFLLSDFFTRPKMLQNDFLIGPLMSQIRRSKESKGSHKRKPQKGRLECRAYVDVKPVRTAVLELVLISAVNKLF